MMIKVSIVTMSRRSLLERVLDTLSQCGEEIEVLVTDNASTDDTLTMLKDREIPGRLQVFPLTENRGTAGGRNAQAKHWVGNDMVRLDDKCLPLAPGWLKSLKRQAYERHSIVAVPYDPTVLHLWQVAPCVDYVGWDIDQGQGGPVIFIPAEVTEKLGLVDELHPDIKYGWDDVLYIERARLLGWNFGFSLRAPFEFLASATPAARSKALEYHPLYCERLRQYKEAERDLYIPFGVE